MSSESAAGHARAIVPLFAFSVLGILSTAAFQLLVIRQLGPSSFGLLAGYLALINVASIGSSAVRNSVAVGVARIDLQRNGARDRTFFEACVYGSLFAVGVVLMLASGAYTSPWAGLWVAVSVLPYFIFARAQGLMQGSGQVTRVLLWSTGAQVAQLIFALIALSLGWGWLGVLFAIMLVSVFGAAGSTWQAAKSRLASTVKPFSGVTVRALLTTVAFTWLISMDVTWVQKFASPETAGEYGASATLIKVAFLVPTTLALYLLPKFASNINDRSFQLRGLVWSSAAAAVSGFLFAAVLWLWPALLTILFGESYARVGEIAFWVALAFLPWVIAQSIVTQVTARGSLAPIILLGVAALLQFFFAQLVLPNIFAWILVQGLLGLFVLGALVIVFVLGNRSSRSGCQ